MPEERPSADDLRQAAQYLEELEQKQAGLGSHELPLQLVVCGAQDFPREAPRQRAAAQALAAAGRGESLLDQVVIHPVAALYTLAEAIEQGQDVPSVLLILLQPYIDASKQGP